ncbi:MAG: arginine--tRNA ligase, partial [Pseudolabrys sp.]
MDPTRKNVNLYKKVHALVIESTAASFPPGVDTSRIVVEPPRDRSHGDWATNAAMVMAKEVGQKPSSIAASTADSLRQNEMVQKVEIAGPGFINLSLKPHVWGEELRLVLETGKDYGRSEIGKGEKINVEYVSANPTGPMHVGHGRGAVFGDALANLLTFAGYDVTREYYINDA